MVELPGGTFLMGTNDPEAFPADREGPVREAQVDPFLIDPAVVTNARFGAFVRQTNYVTESERIGWSFVFHHFVDRRLLPLCQRHPNAPWWAAVPGATWRTPEGPRSGIDGREEHPVVHVSWNDAMAYCEWSGLRLPTEAEWEYAARGGLEQKRYPWGDELTPSGQHRCNIWQGEFPQRDIGADGYRGTAPARSFPPNGFGLYNMSGNVWEWCSDWFHTGPGTGRVVRGGSYLCHRSYCNRYRVAARTSNTPDSAAGHMGFRCVADGPRRFSR